MNQIDPHIELQSRSEQPEALRELSSDEMLTVAGGPQVTNDGANPAPT